MIRDARTLADQAEWVISDYESGDEPDSRVAAVAVDRAKSAISALGDKAPTLLLQRLQRLSDRGTKG